MRDLRQLSKRSTTIDAGRLRASLVIEDDGNPRNRHARLPAVRATESLGSTELLGSSLRAPGRPRKQLRSVPKRGRERAMDDFPVA